MLKEYSMKIIKVILLIIISMPQMVYGVGELTIAGFSNYYCENIETFVGDAGFYWHPGYSPDHFFYREHSGEYCNFTPSFPELTYYYVEFGTPCETSGGGEYYYIPENNTGSAWALSDVWQDRLTGEYQSTQPECVNCEIKEFSVDNLNINPGSSDPNLQNTANFTVDVILDTRSWDITIKNSGGNTVKTISGTGGPSYPSWDGKDTSGNYVSVGTYSAKLNVYKEDETSCDNSTINIVVENCADDDTDTYYGYNVPGCPSGLDCDDTNDEINPDTIWYKDLDNDFYSDNTTTGPQCDRPTGYQLYSSLISSELDCDESNILINPGATEVCDGVDNNCVDGVDEGFADDDGDGYASCDGALDCNDDPNNGGADINPSATEVCDDIDNNCVDGTDEGFDKTWYIDADGDNYTPGTTMEQCDQPSAEYKQVSGLTSLDTDCNDGNSAINPDAAEVCDGADNNCAGGTDEGNPGGGVACNVAGKLGICESGETICQGGGIQCDQTVFPSSKDCQSALDNDCDGTDDNLDASCNGSPIGPDPEMCVASKVNYASGRYSHSQSLFGGLGLVYNSFGPYSSTIAPQWTHSYDLKIDELSDGTAILTDANGDKRSYLYDNGSYISDSSDTSILTQVGQNWLLTELDGTEQRFNVSDGKLISISDLRGRSVMMTYTSGLLYSIDDSNDPAAATIAYDANDIIESVTDPEGNIYNFNYYGNGTLQEIVYPLPISYTLDVPQGDGTTSPVSYPDGGASNPKWTYTYDNGLLKSKLDTNGKLTTYIFTDGKYSSSVETTDYGNLSMSVDFGNYTGQLRETSKTGRNGGIWKYRYNAADNRLQEKEDPFGGIMKYEYEGDTVMHVTEPGNKHKTTSRHDSQFNLVTQIETDLVAMSSYSTTYTYDANGRMLSMTEPLEEAYDGGGSPVTSKTSFFTYTGNGDILSMNDGYNGTTDYSYTTIGTDKHVTVTDTLNRVTTSVYDDKDRIKTVTMPGSLTTAYTYGAFGNLSSVTDAASRITHYRYDSLGNMVQVIAPGDIRTTYEYDEDGSLKRVIDAEGNAMSYSYTNTSQQKSITDALLKSTFISYTSTGKMSGLTDPNGKRTSYDYDAIGRLKTRKVSDINGSNLITEKSYNYTNRYEYDVTDANGTVTYKNDYMGRPLEKQDDGVALEKYTYTINGWLKTAETPGLVTYTYKYFPDGSVKSVRTQMGGLDKTIEYTYDAAGNRLAMSGGDISSVNYVIGAFGNMTAMTTGAGLFSFDYNADGSRDKLTYPNGIVTSYGYDGAGRFDNISSKFTSAAYTLNASGNRGSSTREDGTKVDYGYDKLYRLKFASYSSASGAQLENYSYDDIGNRLVGSNNLISPPQSSGTKSLEYDYDNRLVKVTLVSGGVTTVVDYKYDPFGRRVERKVTVGGQVQVTLNYFYDNEDIIAVYEDGSLSKEFIHGPGIDESLAVKSGGSWYYYHADGLGSVMVVTDSAGDKVGTSFGYDSFGNLIQGNLDETYTYTGREYDKEAGLYYYRARFYDATIGRFISKDPIGFAGGDVNLYSYVKQNPVNWTDPLGLEILKCATKAGGLLGLFDHEWLKTSTKEAGMGPVDETQKSSPYYTDVMITDHSDPNYYPKDRCEEVKDVDEQCVNDNLMTYKQLGTWSDKNHCQKLVKNILKKCSTKQPTFNNY